VVFSIISLAVLFINVDRNKKTCYLETYNSYCKKHQVTNLEIPGIKIDATKACRGGHDACGFIGLDENNEYKLKLKICREIVDVDLLSTDFIKKNSDLIINFLNDKYAESYTERLFALLDAFFKMFSPEKKQDDIRLDKPGLKRFISTYHPAGPDMELLLALYYLKTKWIIDSKALGNVPPELKKYIETGGNQ
jgi:hypothetical protein